MVGNGTVVVGNLVVIVGGIVVVDYSMVVGATAITDWTGLLLAP